MGIFYQTKLQDDPRPQGRANHGARWTPEHYDALKQFWFHTDKSFAEICDEMGRSWASVMAKLSEQGWAKYDAGMCAYTYDRNKYRNKSEPQYTETKETIMSNANIETKTFIAGTDASTMDDAQVFRHIAKLEGEVDKLKAIRAKSTKLSAAIKKLERDIAELVAYIDAR